MRRGDDNRSSCVDDLGDQVLAVGRRRAGRSDVLQHVDARLEGVADVALGVDVREYPNAVFVRGADDRFVVVERQPCVRLDVIDAGDSELLGLLRRFFRRRDVDAAEAVLHRAAGAARDPRSADEQARAVRLPLVDPIAHAEDRLQRRSEIDRRRHARHQQLLRRDLHDARQHGVATVRLDPWKPGVVAAVAEDDEVAVCLDEAGQHRAPTGVDDDRVGRNLHFGRRTRRNDLVAFDEDSGAMNRRNLVPGHQHAADEREPLRRLRASRGRADERGGHGSDRYPSTDERHTNLQLRLRLERIAQAPLNLAGGTRRARDEERGRVHVPVVPGQVHVVRQVERLEEHFHPMMIGERERLGRAHVEAASAASRAAC